MRRMLALRMPLWRRGMTETWMDWLTVASLTLTVIFAGRRQS